MQQSEATALIAKGITGTSPQHWADLGCGKGTFTFALAQLLPPGSNINAIDIDRQQLPGFRNDIKIDFIRMNFAEQVLPLSALDGILMANSLHYVADKAKLISQLENSFNNKPRFLIVEYDTMKANPWVPYPISFLNLKHEFSTLGYQTHKLAEIRSRFGGTMYSALALK